MAKIAPQRRVKAVEAIFGEFLNYKSGITTLVWLLEVPFLGLKDGHFFAKVTKKKWHFGWPIQNSKTTFIVQTFPKYSLYIQLYHFWALFWPYFNYVDFRASFGHFSLEKRVYIYAKKTTEGGLK